MITSTVDQKNIHQRITSYTQYNDEEKDDMYEFLFFKQNFGNDIGAGAAMYERNDKGDPAWLTYNEAIDRVYLEYKNILEKNRKDTKDRYEKFGTWSEKAGYDLDLDIDELIQNKLVNDVLKK
jgi:hypothetical protein